MEFWVPDVCELCGAGRSVLPATTVSGDLLRLTWTCGICHGHWPVTDAERVAHVRLLPKPDRRRGSSSADYVDDHDHKHKH